jgi:Ca2+/Na+ antiporter
MGMGESVFTIIFIIIGVVAIGAGINFDNEYRKEYKGVNKAEYIKVNKIGLISMGSIMLIGIFIGQMMPVFKEIIVFIIVVCWLVIGIIYSVIWKKKFHIKK